MALGTSRTRNWGKDAQASALSIAMERGKVVYQIRNSKLGKSLWLAASANGVTLPFTDVVRTLFM